MDDHGRRDTARKIEVGTSIAAGTVGSALGATKLRDAFKEEHEAAYARGEQRLARTTSPKVARFVAHAKPGFKPLVAGTSLAVTATAASKYRQKKDHEAARARLAKAAPSWAVLKSSGKRVRVLHQHSKDHFMVMDHTDTQRLVHRDHITFIKARPKTLVSKKDDDTPPVVQGLQRLNGETLRLRRKVVPTKADMAAKVANAGARVKTEVQEDLQKAYDPKRGPRRRARAVEAGAVAGAGVAATGAVRDRRASGRAFENSRGAEAAAHTNFRVARLHGGEVADHLKRYGVAAGKPGNRPSSRVAVGATLHHQKRSFDQLEHGTESFTRAFNEGREGHRLVRRANRSTLAAAGLTAVALKARSVARRNKA